VIKHLGDHEFHLDEGKDTTLFYEAGADISTGIDAHKTVSTLHNTDLDKILDYYVTIGIHFAVIEGYKQRSFAKIVIGNLEIDRCILSNPSIEEVIQSLNQFDEYPI